MDPSNEGKDNLRFPEIAKKQCGIDAVEYVNAFFKEKAKDKAYLKELKARTDDLGVKNVLIMVDGEGALGDADQQKRQQAIDNHKQWVEAAKYLGCHSIRVNAQSSGTPEEQSRQAADGLRRLSEWAKQHDINVIVENHGGLSSNGSWLAGVIKSVDLPNCGTLPDFGNFKLGQTVTEADGVKTVCERTYDRYRGVNELMPSAKAVSAKSHQFNQDGNETGTDYFKMMKIVLDHGYHGYVGIEWEGEHPGEMEGIRLTKELLERVRSELA
ncbi:Xylose isomerase-like TIM barrel [Adhaeretor mobilis]|uniref:Xylose isomerase-like TIM barrel n=2 Tax=Adhaeretor mobilis TaxID=1930276 RepID=A0A517MU70_9BACT|nr:Xylose isomerase-like TIM barrel [Adhaeretor mobilis]